MQLSENGKAVTICIFEWAMVRFPVFRVGVTKKQARLVVSKNVFVFPVKVQKKRCHFSIFIDDGCSRQRWECKRNLDINYVHEPIKMKQWRNVYLGVLVTHYYRQQSHRNHIAFVFMRISDHMSAEQQLDRFYFNTVPLMLEPRDMNVNVQKTSYGCMLI